MDIAEKVKNTRWHRDWAGQEFLLQASMDVDANFDYMREFIGITHGAYLLLLDGDGCSGNYPQEPHERLSLVAAERARDPDFLAHWCSEFKNLSDRVLPVLLGDTEELLSRLPEIYPSYERYGTYQIACKAAFNSLNLAGDEKILAELESARTYSEMFYTESLEALRRASVYISERHASYTPALLQRLVVSELLAYFSGGRLPDTDVLESRMGDIGWYIDEQGQECIPAGRMKEIQRYWMSRMDTDRIQGATAYPGTVRATARIMKSPDEKKEFHEGDILVTTMTDPRYLPLMKKAGAIVTDSGGLLCHAAITSRELKIPCLIGTLYATKVIKDGDMIEVDATNGVARIIAS